MTSAAGESSSASNFKAQLTRLDLAHLPTRPLVMGILNVTPDSFSDGGEFLDSQRAVARGVQMVAEGAGCADGGAESARPGALPVPDDEQLARAIPVIRALASNQLDQMVSIDTRSANVAHEAILAGAGVVNDVSALRDDPGMAD